MNFTTRTSTTVSETFFNRVVNMKKLTFVVLKKNKKNCSLKVNNTT